MQPSLFVEFLQTIAAKGGTVVDVGCFLKIGKGTSPFPERPDKPEKAIIKGMRYVVLDVVPEFKPDVVGDVMAMPFKDNEFDAIICVAVMAHVKEPQKAVDEMRRCLKPGGYLFISFPFINFYCGIEGYFDDYFRYTESGVRYLLRDFKGIKIQRGRGRLSTVMNLFPIFTHRTGLFDWIDRRLPSSKSNQITQTHFALCWK
jgi:SAM-dependent methyltransferase